MSWTSGANLTNFASAVSGTTVTFTGVAISAGTLIILGWDANVASLSATCADNSTQSGAANSYNVLGSLNATTFTAGVVWVFTTRDILSTDTITVTLSGAATRISGSGTTFTVTSNNPILDTSSEIRLGATTSPVTTSASALHQASELGVAFSFCKTGAVATGTTFGASQLNSPSTHTEANSGGSATTVATRITTGLTISAASGTTGWSYTAGFAQVNLQTLFFYEGAAIIPDAYAPSQGSRGGLRPAYVPPASRAFQVFDNNAPPSAQGYAPVFVQPGVVRYRGSYSINASAADEAIGSSTDYAAPVVQRPTPPYRAPLSLAVAVFAPAPVVPDTFAQVSLSRAAAYYRPPPSQVEPVFFQPAVQFGTDFALVAQGYRPPPLYRAPLSQVIASFTPNPPGGTDWAAVFQGNRAFPDYRAPLSLVVPVWDPATNTFADWTPGVIASRPSPFYRTPAETFVTAWGTSVVSDQLAPVALSRPVAFYRSPAAQATLAASNPALVVQGYAPVIQSRRLDLRAIASRSLASFPNNAIVVVAPPPQGGGGEWVIWAKPQFPANTPGAWRSFPPFNFRKPTRRVP